MNLKFYSTMIQFWRLGFSLWGFRAWVRSWPAVRLQRARRRIFQETAKTNLLDLAIAGFGVKGFGIWGQQFSSAVSD